MGNITEIKEKLDKLYEEYRKNKSQLNKEKTKEAAKLLFELTFNENSVLSEIASQLSRFSADVVKLYFDKITKDKSIPINLLDEIIKEFLITDKDSNKSQYYVQKYSSAITSIMKNYKDKALSSVQLPRLVAFIAQFAVKSEKNRNKFQDLINSTMGGIFMLDYTDIKKNSLVNVWNATNSLFPDLSKVKYESLVTDWGKKYGFITPSKSEEPVPTDNKVKIEESVVAKETPKEEVSVAVQSPVKTENVSPNPKKEEPKAHVTDTAASEKEDKLTSVPESPKADASAEKTVANDDEKASTNTSEVAASEKAPAKKSSVQVLYERLKRDMDKEQEAIITAFTDMITPVGKAFESIQGEISKNREIGAENVSLKAKIADLERQLSEQRDRFQTVNQSLMAARTENEELKIKVAALESQNAELDSKLNDAYAINSRESSLEAEKIRLELKKAFAFLYEDWLEYEFSDVSEDNYESLQAIIKKIFRSLERNGIDFKGNN
ncbi:MAG: hypothetical protein ACI4JA_04945 [Oscillospiraceae bacterium]